jgi:hypothetical protein
VFDKYFGAGKSSNTLQEFVGGKLGSLGRGIKRGIGRVRTSGGFGARGRKAGGSAAKSVGAGAKTAEAFEGLGAVAGKAAGGLAIVATVAITVVQGFIKAYQAVDTWTENAMASAAKLAEVSGSMAAVMATREYNQAMRDIERGEATAGSTGKLQEAESRRKDEENKLGIVVDNATNQVLTVLNDLVTPILTGMNNLLKGLSELPWGVGRVIKGLMSEEEKNQGSFESLGSFAMRESQRIDAAGDAMMNRARNAAAQAAAQPPGRLP